MPLRFIRILAVAMALIVPVQGMAAIAAAQCMGLGHHQAEAGDHEGHGAADATDGHDHAAHSHEASPNVATDDSADPQGAHCGPCAACCATASIASAPAFSILSSPSDAAYVFSQFPPPGVQPDGVDRPPLAP